MSQSICQRTTENTFPHHWKCLYLEGHPGCTCGNDEKIGCQAYECYVNKAGLSDNGRRVPDNSGSAREHLEAGNLAVRYVNLGTGEEEIRIIPKSED
jgi:hypothetical protein